MKSRMNFGQIYDHFEKECPGQTVSREEFVKQCAELTDPHQMMNDLQALTFEREKQRTLAMYEKRRIDEAVQS